MRTSLIIATYERGDLLARSLARLSLLTLPDEVVVVDDGGQDNTEEVCAQSPVPVTYLWNNNPGWTNSCLARNIALAHSTGDHVVTAEPELLFLTDVIAQLCALRELEDHVLHEHQCYHEPHDHVATTVECNVVPGFYVHSFKREWLEAVGGWDEEMPGPWGWDDIDLYGRLEHTGHPRRGVYEVKVQHQWHPSRIEPAVENERHCRAKQYPRDLVANTAIFPGRLRP